MLDVPLDELVPFIDWTFFFAAWELKGRFPAILDHPQYGAAARELYDNARALLDRIMAEQLLGRAASTGSGRPPARATTSSSTRTSTRSGELTRFNMLRQQETIADGKPNLSLADFVAPIASSGGQRLSRRLRGHRGSWRRRCSRARFEAAHDDYNAIIVKALADRLAEAFAAYLHATARDANGASQERSTPDDVMAERIAASGPGSAIPRVLTTARSSSCSICWTPPVGHRR